MDNGCLVVRKWQVEPAKIERRRWNRRRTAALQPLTKEGITLHTPFPSSGGARHFEIESAVTAARCHLFLKEEKELCPHTQSAIRQSKFFPSTYYPPTFLPPILF